MAKARKALAPNPDLTEPNPTFAVPADASIVFGPLPSPGWLAGVLVPYVERRALRSSGLLVFQCACGGQFATARFAVSSNALPVLQDATAEARELLRGRAKEAKRRGRVQTREKRLEILGAATREPIDWRQQHGALQGESGAVVERHAEQKKDARGRLSAPHRVFDTLAVLRRNGRITKGELDAGRTFEEDFGLAQLDPRRARSYIRVSGGVPELTDAAVAERRRVNGAVEAVGGHGSAMGTVCWYVLGCGQTLREFGSSGVFGGRRRMDERTAQGLLIGASGLLDRHYHPTRRRT